MNGPIIGAMPFLVIMIITIIYSNVFANSGKSQILDARKKQALGMRSNNFRVKFSELANSRVKFSKRESIETLCLNAGFDWKYSDYLLICVGLAAALFFVFGIIVGNIYLGALFAFLGYKAPGQILGFIKTRRLEKLETQIGPFMKMVVKRYEFTSDFEKAMINTAKEFYGTEPLYTELSKTVSEISIGVSIPEALDNLAKRTANKYLGLLADYYRIAYILGTDEVRKKLLGQAYEQYEENRKMLAFMKEQISEPKRDAYLMVIAFPLFFLFGVFFMDDYLDFILNDPIGQIGLAVCVSVVLAVIWFINNVVAAPIDKRKNQEAKQAKEKRKQD